jgi:hypothetical protein
LCRFALAFLSVIPEGNVLFVFAVALAVVFPDEQGASAP